MHTIKNNQSTICKDLIKFNKLTVETTAYFNASTSLPNRIYFSHVIALLQYATKKPSKGCARVSTPQFLAAQAPTIRQKAGCPPRKEILQGLLYSKDALRLYLCP